MGGSEILRTDGDELKINNQEKTNREELEIMDSEPNTNEVTGVGYNDQEEISNPTNQVQSYFQDLSLDLPVSKNDEQNRNSGISEESNDPSSMNSSSANGLQVYDFNQLTRKFKPEKGCDYQPDSVKVNSTTSSALCALKEMPPELIFVTREEWGAIPPKKVSSKPHVTTVVVFTYATNSDSCSTPRKCEKVVRKLQRHHMRGGLPDIPYNFLVGGDGRIYEGRGWFANPRTLVQLSKLRGHLIEIAYIGNYRVERPSEAMFDAALELIDYGRKNFWVKERFGLLENYESIDITAIDME